MLLDDAAADDEQGFSAETEIISPMNRQEQRLAQKEEEEAREVDRILQKIAASGMGSLTKAEQSMLQRATERKRRGQA